jgi:hypothetical protein
MSIHFTLFGRNYNLCIGYNGLPYFTQCDFITLAEETLEPLGEVTWAYHVFGLFRAFKYREDFKWDPILGGK